MFLVLTIVSVFLLYFLFAKRDARREELLSKIPGPESLPIIKNAHIFYNLTPVENFNTLQHYFDKLGPVWKLEVPTSTMIFTRDHKIIEQILTSQEILDKSDEYSFFHKWMGLGLLVSTGEQWHKMRKLLTPAFHFKILEQMYDVIEKNGNQFIEILKKSQGQQLDVFPLIFLYTLDTICESAMGCSKNALNESESEYVKAVQGMADIIISKCLDVTKRIALLYRFSNDYKSEEKYLKTIHGFTNSVIDSRRNVVQQNNNEEINEDGTKKRMAFLDLLLKVNLDGKPLSDKAIRDEAETFMFEGHDTTTSGIAFTLLNLAKYPALQQQVYEECISILGDDLEKPASMQELGQLNYMEMFIKETQRIYPSVPVLARKLTAETTLGDYTFPKDTTINIFTYNLHRDPKFFPDPLKFDPLRFDGNHEINIFSYVPFSAGPRNCIGQKFAMLEMKSIISKIVRNFEITVKDEHKDPNLYLALVLRAENGVNLTLKSRK